MNPTIHEFYANDLETQGLGSLVDCISCEVTEELNGAYTLEMHYPLHGNLAEYLIPGNVIVATANHIQQKQAFRINQVRKSFSNSITVYANHISYDLSGYAYRWARTYNSLYAVLNALNSVSYGSVGIYHKFTFLTNMTSNAVFKMSGVQTIRSWMGGQEGSIIDTYGGEWVYDNFECTLVAKRGADTGVRISYGKNLSEYEKQRDYTQYSHLCAFWKKGDAYACGDLIETRNLCTFRVAYIDASNQFDTVPTTAQLNTIATAQIPTANAGAETITVTPAQLGNDSIGLGDTVLVCYEDVFETRVVKTVWDAIANRYKTLELGTKKANIADTIKSLSNTSSPADIITEEGTSNGWTFRKWANGDYECWYRASSTANITTAWGSVYYTELSAVAYPITFADYPIVNMTLQAANGGAWFVPNYSNYSKSSTGSIYLYRPTTVSNMNYTINIHAKGRWK